MAANSALNLAFIQASDSTEINLNRNLYNSYSMLEHVLPNNFGISISNHDAMMYMRRYGCYCFPVNTGTVGPRFSYHGEPLDELDSKCRDFYRAQTCLTTEFETDHSYTCDPSTVFPYYIDTDNSNEIVCGHWSKDTPYVYSSINEENCAMQKCELEKLFVFEVAQLIADGFQDNDSIRKIDDVDYQSFCPSIGRSGSNGNQVEHQCCGNGIQRKKFNSLVSQCCNDNIQALGNCS